MKSVGQGICVAVLCGVLGSTGAVLAQSQCPSGLVGYWPLDGNGTEVVNGFPGTLVGNVGFVPGIVGQAVDLDGSGSGSYVDAGTHAELTDFGGSQMSVAAWIYREPDGPAGDPDGAVITARTFCNEGNFQFYGNLGGSVYYSKWLAGTEDQTFSAFGIPLGVWTHVAVTYATNEVRFYVNGLLFDNVTPLPFGGAINNFVQNVQIGWDSCGSFWTGLLDEVAVYDVTLTDADVADLHQDGVDGVSLCVDDEDGDGVTDDLDVCSDTVIPEAVPTRRLGRNRWALVDGDGVFDTNTPPGGGPGLSFTINDTGGCSCEQIIDELGLGKGHEKFGCSTGAMKNWVALVNP